MFKTKLLSRLIKNEGKSVNKNLKNPPKADKKKQNWTNEKKKKKKEKKKKRKENIKVVIN